MNVIFVVKGLTVVVLDFFDISVKFLGFVAGKIAVSWFECFAPAFFAGNIDFEILKL